MHGLLYCQLCCRAVFMFVLTFWCNTGWPSVRGHEQLQLYNIMVPGLAGEALQVWAVFQRPVSQSDHLGSCCGSVPEDGWSLVKVTQADIWCYRRIDRVPCVEQPCSLAFRANRQAELLFWDAHRKHSTCFLPGCTALSIVKISVDIVVVVVMKLIIVIERRKLCYIGHKGQSIKGHCHVRGLTLGDQITKAMLYLLGPGKL